MVQHAIFGALVLLLASCSQARAQDAFRSARQLEEAGDLKGSFAQYVNALQQAPKGSAEDQRLREKIIDLALQVKPPPAVPEESVKHAVRGQTLGKLAKTGNDGDVKEAAAEYWMALRLAPWWAQAYFNYGLLEEAIGRPAEATWAYRLYIRAAPNAPDVERVKRRAYEQDALAERVTGRSEFAPTSANPAQDRRGAWLGVVLGPITEEIAEKLALAGRRGVLVSAIQEGGPAQYGGIQANDVVVAIDNKDVSNPESVVRLVAEKRAGDVVVVGLLRRGKQIILDVRSGRRPTEIDRCRDVKETNVVRIGACTAIIRSGNERNIFYAEYFFSRGRLLEGAGQFDRALSDFDAAISLVPTANAYYSRGRVSWRMLRQERAIEDFTEAIKLNQNDSDAFNARGVAYTAKAQYDEAIRDFDQAIRLDSVSAIAYYNRGLAKQKAGDNTGAKDDFDRARKIDPSIGK